MLDKGLVFFSAIQQRFLNENCTSLSFPSAASTGFQNVTLIPMM